MEEEQVAPAEQQQVEQWYTPLTRVTSLSKYLAMTLFVVLPLLGFWLGVEWGRGSVVLVDHTRVETSDQAVPGTVNDTASTTQSESKVSGSNVIPLDTVAMSKMETIAQSGDSKLVKGSSGVFVCNTYLSTCEERLDIDAGTVMFVDERVPYGEKYVADKDRVFYFGSGSLSLIPDADPDTFQALGKGYSRDAYSAYYTYNKVFGADPATFTTEVEPDSLIAARDASHEYFADKVVLDESRVTYNEEGVAEVDGIPVEGVGNGYYKNSTGVYVLEYDGSYREYVLELDQFDPATFQYVGPCWTSGNAVRLYYVKDKDSVYCGHFGDGRMDADPSTFTLLDGSFGDERGAGVASVAKDQEHVYLPYSVVEQADPDTFEILDSAHARDRYHTYQYSDLTGLNVVEETDPNISQTPDTTE